MVFIHRVKRYRGCLRNIDNVILDRINISKKKMTYFQNINFYSRLNFDFYFRSFKRFKNSNKLYFLEFLKPLKVVLSKKLKVKKKFFKVKKRWRGRRRVRRSRNLLTKLKFMLNRYPKPGKKKKIQIYKKRMFRFRVKRGLFYFYKCKNLLKIAFYIKKLFFLFGYTNILAKRKRRYLNFGTASAFYAIELLNKKIVKNSFFFIFLFYFLKLKIKKSAWNFFRFKKRTKKNISRRLNKNIVIAKKKNKSVFNNFNFFSLFRFIRFTKRFIRYISYIKMYLYPQEFIEKKEKNLMNIYSCITLYKLKVLNLSARSLVVDCIYSSFLFILIYFYEKKLIKSYRC